ncbi:hypothetical protein LD32_gp63 [Escherichia phage vB_EcoS_AHP42]|uniref:Uncharacterized protein n=3 Tax=Rogunavirus TaxID=1920866 RepID=A0A7T7K8B4_9CAUD|nr:hypothetical protein LD32_gp63 [Escherichia phage vB_EcoS_AHP42]AHI60609.1 hypothetical protein AHP42_63 [Escherichia phage vB_EcoS_AHP42]QQM15565.1 hypothetical protein BECP10_00077 [Escherichia phage vB_EcoS-BECP10]WCI99778.1 hypothetical protein UDF157lw_00001 [Escherichia phage vB_EcoS-UDF157lw]
MSKTTLGEVIRFMAKKALQSEDKEFKVPVRDIYRQIRGHDYPEMETDDKTGDIINLGERKLSELKNSYIHNTLSRMRELREAKYIARYQFIWIDADGEDTTPRQYDGDGADKYLLIHLTEGVKEPKAKQREKEEKERAVIEKFKSRLLKLSPNVLDFEGDELTGAVKAIRMYQEMIKEFN